MNEPDRKERNVSMLAQCWPRFGASISDLISRMEALSFRPRIQCAWRSAAEQKIAQETGHSQLAWGFHNATGAAGQMEALACDVLNDDLPLDPGRSYLYALAREARALGLTTGILWGVPSLGMRNQTWSAVMANDLVSAVKIGFDPTHVQVTGLTPMEAKAGKRP